MNKFFALCLSGLSAIALALALAAPALADNDYFKPVTDPLTTAECSECHMLYPVGILPASSWSKMIHGLDDHFGVNASVSPEDAVLLEAYLTRNAGPEPRRGRLGAVRPVVLRITELPSFTKDHKPSEISPIALAKYKAKSIADCVACHKLAEKGDFD